MRSIAVIGGSFKPPHRGHLAMLKEYAREADEVLVLVSDPKKDAKSLRKIGEKIVDPEVAVDLLRVYCEAAGLDNVRIKLSPDPSPIRAAYAIVEKMRDRKVIVGCSDKGDDWKRWERMESTMSKKNPSVEIETTTVGVTEEVSSTELREAIERGNFAVAATMVPDEVKNRKYLEKVMAMLWSLR